MIPAIRATQIRAPEPRQELEQSGPVNDPVVPDHTDERHLRVDRVRIAGTSEPPEGSLDAHATVLTDAPPATRQEWTQLPPDGSGSRDAVLRGMQMAVDGQFPGVISMGLGSPDPPGSGMEPFLEPLLADGSRDLLGPREGVTLAVNHDLGIISVGLPGGIEAFWAAERVAETQ